MSDQDCSQNPRARQFTDLQVWQDAHEFVLDIYRFSRDFPDEERFGLTSQLRRAAVSIAANIVEGFKRKGRPDKLRMYNIAQASLEECRYFLILSGDLNYGDVDPLKQQSRKLAKRLASYIRSVEDDEKKRN
jgi:four helix bundle protein